MQAVRCRIPELPPMVGFAVTLRVRASNPAMDGRSDLDQTDWWPLLQAANAPHVLVIQDMDRKPGAGAFVGEVHAAILQAMGCVGVITNGAVRDLSRRVQARPESVLEFHIGLARLLACRRSRHACGR